MEIDLGHKPQESSVEPNKEKYYPSISVPAKGLKVTPDMMEQEFEFTGKARVKGVNKDNIDLEILSIDMGKEMDMEDAMDKAIDSPEEDKTEKDDSGD